MSSGIIEKIEAKYKSNKTLQKWDLSLLEAATIYDRMIEFLAMMIHCWNLSYQKIKAQLSYSEISHNYIANLSFTYLLYDKIDINIYSMILIKYLFL